MEKQKCLTVNAGKKPCYDILYTDDFDGLWPELEKLGYAGRKIAIITDSNVAPLYGEQVLNCLQGRASEADLYTFPAGEENKNLDTVRGIYQFLIERHYERKDLLIALGGGVVGDITGFAAATYLRGINFVQIPTSLLAQADSSIGGKTGVDFDGYKNMVGAFKMPILVYENVSVLHTLDARRFADGFAEIMKHGLIKDQHFYEWLIDHIYEINERDSETLQEMLYNSNMIKKLVVEKDPFEENERKLLNFGHTLGHAIEKHRNFELFHGECVALGCVAAAFISWKKELLSMEEYYEIRDMFVPFGLPISVEDIDIEQVIALTHSDKKMENGQIKFILLKKVGKAFIDTSVTDEEMRNALQEILYIEDGE